LQFIAETDKCSNNIVEHKAVLLGLLKLRAMAVQNCILKMDAKVIAGKIERECMARDATLERYLATIRRMENNFKGFIVEYIKRAKNIVADELAKIAARKAALVRRYEPRTGQPL
jgi:ribonuclease HI